MVLYTNFKILTYYCFDLSSNCWSWALHATLAAVKLQRRGNTTYLPTMRKKNSHRLLSSKFINSEHVWPLLPRVVIKYVSLPLPQIVNVYFNQLLESWVGLHLTEMQFTSTHSDMLIISKVFVHFPLSLKREFCLICKCPADDHRR